MNAMDAPTDGLRVSLGTSRPGPALLVLAATLVLIVIGLWPTPEGRRPGPHHGGSDVVLYQRVIDDVRHGVPYYQAAAQEQRRHGYPMRPFVVVRPPLLAVTMAALPNDVARQILFDGLALATFAAWGWRLVGMGAQRLDLALGMALLGTGVAVTLPTTAYLFHETWAGLLIALSLALRRPERWVLSLVVGLIAALTRELAAAYLLAMAALALRDGCRREALGWIAALAVVAVALAAHAVAVDAQILPGDPASQGWLNIGGWRFVLAAIHWNIVLIGAPLWLGALAAPLALLGLLVWRDPLAERVALTVFGYVAAFVFVGRPENSYWGLLIAPLWPLGLLMAPRAILALWGNVRLRGAPAAALTQR